MKRQFTWKDTQLACYVGYITQAIVVILPSLLFAMFRSEFGITFSQLSTLIGLLFVIQIFVDFISAPIIDKVGYRTASCFGFACCCIGLCLMSILPFLIPVYPALLVALTVASVGSGCMEVLISPITESLPRSDKEKAMSLLHSFYCWGCVAVILFSTFYFSVFGIEKWFCLPLLCAFVPFFGFMAFLMRVPLYPLVKEGKPDTIVSLIHHPEFWILFVMMICAGASEQTISQWVSLFAEQGLGVTKTVGDLIGPCLFAICMGISRIFLGKHTNENNIPKLLLCSAGLCVFCYILIILSKLPLLSLFGCAFTGFSVGLMWPGTFSVAMKTIPAGGTLMFALLAMSGDIGCSVGPALSGAVSDFYTTQILMSVEESMKKGFAAALIFPFLMIISTILIWYSIKKKGRQNDADK